MRADAIDLDLEGTRVRIVCEDPAGLQLLSAALADHIIDEPAPIGFLLRVPTVTTRFHVVIDRSGFVLGRTRSSEEGVGVLASHLVGLMPPPQDTVRLRARAFVVDGESTVSLAALPHFLSQPVIERRLERSGLRVVDRLAVDIGSDATMTLSPMPWPGLADLCTAPGHATTPTESLDIGTVVVPQLVDGAPTTAELVAFLGAITCFGPSHEERLALAEKLSARRVVTVSVGDQSELYDVLGA